MLENVDIIFSVKDDLPARRGSKAGGARAIPAVPITVIPKRPPQAAKDAPAVVRSIGGSSSSSSGGGVRAVNSPAHQIVQIRPRVSVVAAAPAKHGGAPGLPLRNYPETRPHMRQQRKIVVRGFVSSGHKAHTDNTHEWNFDQRVTDRDFLLIESDLQIYLGKLAKLQGNGVGAGACHGVEEEKDEICKLRADTLPKNLHKGSFPDGSSPRARSAFSTSGPCLLRRKEWGSEADAGAAGPGAPMRYWNNGTVPIYLEEEQMRSLPMKAPPSDAWVPRPKAQSRAMSAGGINVITVERDNACI